MSNLSLDTIVAISSGSVNQAISIIRIVGPEAIEIIKKIFTGKIGPNKSIQYGFIRDSNGNLLDEVLVNFFIGTDNFVGEDTVEINAHGGIVVSQKILEQALINGARLATPGEFTRRAFLNGKMSLTKAEAINELINAKTSRQQEIAINSFKKDKDEKISEFIKKVEYLIGLCEVNIDYPEYDDVPILENKDFMLNLNQLIDELASLIKSSESNQIYVRPITIAIVGNPNAGKSTLMNAILNEDKSIVTDIPGTTRDVIESEIILNNLILKFKDTAGIRKASDEIEKIGVERSWNEIEKSDLIIHLIDSTKGMNQFDHEIENKIKSKKHLQVWNKSDLINEHEENKLYISSKSKDISNLSKTLEQILSSDEGDLTSNFIFNQRQTYCLKRAYDSLNVAKKSIEDQMTFDVVIVDLHTAWESLKEIIGNVDKEELLDSIFSNFCLGK